MIMSGSSFLTEAASTLGDYHTFDTTHHYSNKTIDLIGEEFVKKEQDGMIVRSSISNSNSLPSLTYTTTTIPTISSGEEAGVLYYNLDDLSRYIPENFAFDMAGEGMADGLGVDEEGRAMMISVPGEKGTQSFSIQVNIDNGWSFFTWSMVLLRTVLDNSYPLIIIIRAT